MEKEVDVFVHFLHKLTDSPVIKILTGFFIGIIKLLYGPIMRPAYEIVIMLWLADTATGYYHAWKNPVIVPESRKMYHGLVKLCIYYFLLFLGYQCSQIVVTAFLQGIIEGAILLTEGYSILENLEKIATLKGTEIPILKCLMNLLKGKMNELEGDHNEQN